MSSIFFLHASRKVCQSLCGGNLRKIIVTRSLFTSVRNMAERKENRLARERSPYLLQHKHNPVDWYPWSEEAFEKARSQDKPIFLSVGYSTCHWCHVMERESFESEDVASILNEHFVSIKVDREERPDVDRVYMTFVQAMTGHGGWPLNVWLTPDLKPFVGATYFPPNDQPGRPGFKTVLSHVTRQWNANKAKLVQQGNVVMDAIKEHSGEMGKDSGSMPHAQCIEKLFTDMCSSFDDGMGGIGGAPKFPQAALFNFLLRYSKFKSDESGKKALGMFVKTLECMHKGGIHDHVGQGFHRYSTDRDWHVPHFEKMLYDQSQLAVLYIDGFQASKNEILAEAARDILLYVMRDLSHKSGGFYSAEDADSLPSHKDTDKKEGAFCVWEEDELKTILHEKIPTKSGDSIPLSTLFIKYYGVQADGNVKPHQDPHKELRKKNVLIVRESLQETAKSLDLDESEAKEHLARARELLFEERKTRPAPHLDTKMVTAWNGLMISAFARAAQVLGEDVYLKRAIKAAEFVRNYLYDEKSGKLLRSCYKGEGDTVDQTTTPIFGFVDDYGFLIRALLDLYEASMNERWLKWAIQTQETLDELFWDSEGGGYYQVMEGDASILVRMKEAQDGAEPSANSTSVNNLLRLASFTGDKRFRQRAEKILSTFEMLLSKMPLALPEMISGYMNYLSPTKQIIIAGERDADDTKELIRCVHAHFIPQKVLMLCDGKPDSFLASKLEVFKSLERMENKATAYVCENYACQLPVNSAAELQELLASS